MAPQPIAALILDAVGIGTICARIQDGDMLSDICRDIGIARSTLAAWCNSDPDRAAQFAQARIEAAGAYVEAAERAILDAPSDSTELTRARELAHHYRWKASKANPRRYGDRVTQEITGADGGPIQTASITIDATALDPDQRAALRAALTQGGGET